MKKQDKTARTGNFAFEDELSCSRDGRTMPGNFWTCTASGYIIAHPTEVGPTWNYHIWTFLTADLYDLVCDLHHDIKPLTKRAEATNADKEYDRSNCMLVRRELLKKFARHRETLDLLPIFESKEFQAWWVPLEAKRLHDKMCKHKNLVYQGEAAIGYLGTCGKEHLY